MKLMACTIAATVALLGVALAQVPKVVTVEDHDKAMKTIRGNAIQVPKLLEAGALSDVRARYVTIREQFVGVEEFWTSRKKDDVAALAGSARVKVEGIIKAVDASDRPGIDAAIKEFVAVCNQCHAGYRDPDPVTPNSFVIKQGVL
jgi:hypothetical protein